MTNVNNYLETRNIILSTLMLKNFNKIINIKVFIIIKDYNDRMEWQVEEVRLPTDNRPGPS